MSKSRSRRHGWQRPDNGYTCSAPSEKTVQRVLDAGCGGYRDSYTGEYDCSRRYRWSCDDCPIVHAAQETDPEPQLIQLLP